MTTDSSPPHVAQPRLALLRTALFSNALFSFTSGLMLVLLPDVAAELLGNSFVELLRLLGIGLVLFSLLVATEGRRPRVRPAQVLLISSADFVWVPRNGGP